MEPWRNILPADVLRSTCKLAIVVVVGVTLASRQILDAWLMYRNKINGALSVKKSIAGPWKNILKVQVDLSHLGLNMDKMFRCKDGNGCEAVFWSDNWTRLGALKDRFPSLFLMELNKRCVVKDRLPPFPGLDFSWAWKLQNASAPDPSQIILCRSSIPPITLNPIAQDSWGWDDSLDMELSVRSIREVIESKSLPEDDVLLPWSYWLPLKVNAFAWHAGLDRIPSKHNLIIRGIPINPFCDSCKAIHESTDHLLIRCSFASRVWDEIFEWCKAPKDLFLSVKEILCIESEWPISKTQEKILHTIFLTTLWCPWKARNERVFNKKAKVSSDILGEIKLLSFEWIKHTGKCHEITWPNWCIFSF
ncbi:hypothetical protein E3N88_28441 [Mikania micrantha]|uniref:Reverse transcriptase zinc-binding domain-containing protein n=1 Tax=Mikania micrantha TaxID=192012 RepID=A0A5N6N0N4_9ASTR|nr:hypothetical protein E3N88_28441 [Mikania micrantha]